MQSWKRVAIFGAVGAGAALVMAGKRPLGIAIAAGRMPKMISPKAHAALDYAIAGSFVLMGALFWKRNRRAALGSLLCGGATAAVNLLTDYPGGARKMIPFAMHAQIDTGLIAMTAAMPRLMDIEDER